MRKTLPTVKPLIEALQLADLVVRRRFRTERSEIACRRQPRRGERGGAQQWSALTAWVHPGPRTSDSLTGRRAPPPTPPRAGCGRWRPPCCSHRSLEVLGLRILTQGRPHGASHPPTPSIPPHVLTSLHPRFRTTGLHRSRLFGGNIGSPTNPSTPPHRPLYAVAPITTLDIPS